MGSKEQKVLVYSSGGLSREVSLESLISPHLSKRSVIVMLAAAFSFILAIVVLKFLASK